MYRYFFIAKNNMKKQKGDMITFFIMTFIASFMIYLCLNLLVGTIRVIDTNKEKIKGADILIMKSVEPLSDFKLEELIEGNDNLTNFHKDRYLSVPQAKYRKKGVENWSNYVFYLFSYEDERTIQTSSIDTSSFSGNDIVLPISMSTTFAVGDRIELKVGENIYEFKVAGFNEDFIICSSMNFSVYKCFMSDKMFEQILFENRNLVEESQSFNTNLSQKAIKNKVAEEEIIEDLYNDLNIWMISYKKTHPQANLGCNMNFIPESMMKTANMILPDIFISIILVFAFVVLAIAFVVIDFSIKNFIMNNMKNTGIMEASGYTVKEMTLILVVQLLLVSGIGSILGALVGAILQGKIGFIMLYLLGLSWNQPSDKLLLIGVVAGICIMVCLFTVFLGREYKKTSVLEALRGGINNHSYRKNFFPFDKSSLPVFLNIAMKETFGKFKSQIGVIAITAVLAFSAAMGFGIYENLGRDVDSLLRIAGTELPNADVTGDKNMAETIRNFECVDRVSYEVWTGYDLKSGNKTKSVTARVMQDTAGMRDDYVVEGRWPKYENEVAVGTMLANNMEIEIGDSVTVKNGEESASFIVTGFVQTFNNMGQMSYLTEEGYGRVGGSMPIGSIQIYLKKGYTYDDLDKEFKDVYPESELTDDVEATGGLFTMLKVSMQAILAIIMFVTAFIVALSEALIIRTKITKDWRNLGVFKALGFSSKELILQVMFSNIPAIMLGIALGLVAITFLGDKVMLLMFAIFGFRKVPFSLSAVAYISVVLVITGVALLVSYINGRKIKKLEPVKMITEE